VCDCRPEGLSVSTVDGIGVTANDYSVDRQLQCLSVRYTVGHASSGLVCLLT